jgi:hypothetical protein
MVKRGAKSLKLGSALTGQRMSGSSEFDGKFSVQGHSIRSCR